MSRRVPAAAVIGGALVTFLIHVAIVVAIGGWLLMLLLGVLHHEVSPQVPALGYWVSCALSLLLRLVLGGFAPAKHK